MALSQEQQAAVDVQNNIENNRHTNSLQLEAKRFKIEAIRIAHSVLLENAKSKSVDEREVSASDVISFATSLTTFVDQS